MGKRALLAALLLVAPAVSQAKTLDELLVEKGVITKGEASHAMKGESAGSAKVYYNDGTRIDFPDSGFGIKINTLIQARYGFYDNDEDGGEFNRSSFDVNTARLFVTGTAMHNEFRYVLEADFAGNDNDHSFAKWTDQSESPRGSQLNDGYIVWSPCEGWDTRMGQFKTFISRQYNNHPAKYQFADESIVSDHFNLGRSQGASQSFDLADGMVQVGAGIWNGDSAGEGVNRSGVDTNMSGGAYVRANPTGKMDAYEEGDANNTEELATSVGAAYVYSEGKNLPGNLLTDKLRLHTVSADFNAKYGGFSFVGEGFWHEGDYRDDTWGEDFDGVGGYTQVGYFIQPGKWELAGRYGFLDCDNGAGLGICSGNDKINEAGATINYYWWKHQLKAQLGYLLINEDGIEGTRAEEDLNSKKWIFQLSSWF